LLLKYPSCRYSAATLWNLFSSTRALSSDRRHQIGLPHRSGLPHRPLPEGARIQEVTVTRRRVAAHRKWHVCFLCRVPAPAPAKANATLALDIGWRLMADGGIQSSLALINQIGNGAVTVLEGLNEPGNFVNSFNGASSNNWQTVAQVQQAEYAAIQADPTLAGATVLSASPGGTMSGTMPNLAPGDLPGSLEM
jgi:hypothetical protein